MEKIKKYFLEDGFPPEKREEIYEWGARRDKRYIFIAKSAIRFLVVLILTVNCILIVAAIVLLLKVL